MTLILCSDWFIVITRGRNACMGYLWEEGKTAELHDAQGYVLSGDLGRFDKVRIKFEFSQF